MTTTTTVDDELDLGIDSPLRSTDEKVARLTRPQREDRLDRLIEESFDIFDTTIDLYTTQSKTRNGKPFRLAGVVPLLSGGNDSMVATHLFRDRATAIGHANTTIGIEKTREFVRKTCADWGIPLLERTPPRLVDQYRALVLDQGFPGPGHHAKMWQRLKERAFSEIRNDVLADCPGKGYAYRVAFVAGRRRSESSRRTNIPENGRKGSIVWVSPLVNWTKIDLMTYRSRHPDMPQNDVSQLIHMSGECLCGSYASPGERAELDYWFPTEECMVLIRGLEEELRRPEYDHIPVWRKTWGWGAVPELAAMAPKRDRTPKTAGLCGGLCEDRMQMSIFEVLEGTE